MKDIQMYHRTPHDLHIPTIRSFARALTGSAQVGDSYVAAALETLVETHRDGNKKPDQQTALLRSLIAIWLPMAWRLTVSEMPPDGADRDLDYVPPMSRAAFLLHSLAHLEAGEVAEILDVTTAEAGQLINYVRKYDFNAGQNQVAGSLGYMAALHRGAAAGGRVVADRRVSTWSV